MATNMEGGNPANAPRRLMPTSCPNAPGNGAVVQRLKPISNIKYKPRVSFEYGSKPEWSNVTNRVNAKLISLHVLHEPTVQRRRIVSRHWTKYPSVTHQRVVSRWVFLQRNRTKSTIVAISLSQTSPFLKGHEKSRQISQVSEILWYNMLKPFQKY